MIESFLNKMFSYIIEKREIGTGDWKQCAKSRFCNITVEGLIPEHSYEFRVKAENKYGIGKACEASQPIALPKARNRRSNLKGG